MKLAARTTTMTVATVATAGVSGLFLGAAPAHAATEACGDAGTLVAPGICEQTFTAGTESFTPTAQMTKLEVLLVGAGGAGVNANTSGTTGYAAGGGGEVRIVDFSDATDPLTVTVPAPGAPGGVSDGTIDETVANGADGSVDDTTAVATGGASGNGNPGASVPASTDPEYPSYGGGGGAGNAAVGADGGAGVVVDAIAPSGSLFSGDTRCYGGGGAVADHDAIGLPGCGGGGPEAVDGALIPPTPNSGGGSGASTVNATSGASGVVVIRWNAATVDLKFELNGHGTAPATQAVVAGTAPQRPADPTAEGYDFDGWYADAELTVPADFDAPLTASTTFYAKWVRVLPATGGAPDFAQLSIGIASLIAGTGLAALAYRRRAQEN